MIFHHSPTVLHYLKGLIGIEIGASAHNPFGVNAINIDYTDDPEAPWKQLEFKTCGQRAKVDLVAPCDVLPVCSKSIDFVLASHVLEHMHNPINCLLEWSRVAREYIVVILPDRNLCTDDLAFPLTDIKELVFELINGNMYYSSPPSCAHINFFTLETFVALLTSLRCEIVKTLSPDDKVGNGFLVIFRPIAYGRELNETLLDKEMR